MKNGFGDVFVLDWSKYAFFGNFYNLIKKFAKKLANLEHKCYLCTVLNKTFFDMVKFSELYRLLEANGWERKKGKRHHKYVNPDFEMSHSTYVLLLA